MARCHTGTFSSFISGFDVERDEWLTHEPPILADRWLIGDSVFERALIITLASYHAFILVTKRPPPG